ncbi:hypothetical protein MJO28_002818 [Puccinia striiformis f. sp. tritici]|uniref:Uncharacterized protein n=1 Tax=Puccinia striiformis f. sp. tritici TaxID=168172 RepID=A0ACC0ERF8_9BASI|nr:hypothetical protein Pst134EB_006300 [Puccinia striiformis f. sp. tritici]KAI7959027.1 hypothetical protein MJO28_002818 [Puccinia striiformis f. sp. tritici]
MSRNGIIRWSFTSARTHSNRSYSAPPSKKPQQSPLEGIKVLDLSRILAGPSAAQLLGDLGAEVIKIEEPGRGDDTRWLQTQHEQKQEPQVFKPSSTLSNYFISCNRNKKSLTLNLKKPDGIRILRKLVAKSDVLIENFIVGKMEELGIGYEALREINPRLIYSSISGYGTTGPKAKAAGYDVIAAAQSGFMSITGEPDRSPMKTGSAICDIVSGLHSTIGILASLYARDGSSKDGGGMGQKVESSLFESALSLSVNVGSSFLNAGEDAKRWGTSHPSIVPYQAFEARDGYMIIGTTNNRQFEKLCNVLELDELKSDQRFITNSKRVENRVELIEILNDRLKSRPVHEWVDKLNKFGLPCSRINSIREAFDEPQTHARQMIQEVDCHHSKSGKIQLIGTPIKLSQSPLTIRSAPPALGEHTKEILTELGYTDVEIDQLIKDSVI